MGFEAFFFVRELDVFEVKKNTILHSWFRGLRLFLVEILGVRFSSRWQKASEGNCYPDLSPHPLSTGEYL